MAVISTSGGPVESNFTSDPFPVRFLFMEHLICRLDFQNDISSSGMALYLKMLYWLPLRPGERVFLLFSAIAAFLIGISFAK